MVYWVHSRVFVQDKRFWVVLEGVGTRYSVQTGGFVGISGWMVMTVVITMVLVGGVDAGWCTEVVSKSKCSMSNL